MNKKKVKTIVYANVSLYSRKCNCVVKKQSSLKFFSNTFIVKVNRQIFLTKDLL